MRKVPTDDQLAFAAEALRRRQRMAALRLITGQHIDAVALFVFGYTESEDEPSAQDVAIQILEYLAEFIEPLIVPPPTPENVEEPT